MVDVVVNCVQPCWPLKQQLLDLDNNNLMALTLIVFVAVMFCKVLCCLQCTYDDAVFFSLFDCYLYLQQFYLLLEVY